MIHQATDRRLHPEIEPDHELEEIRCFDQNRTVVLSLIEAVVPELATDAAMVLAYLRTEAHSSSICEAGRARAGATKVHAGIEEPGSEGHKRPRLAGRRKVILIVGSETPNVEIVPAGTLKVQAEIEVTLMLH